MKQRDRDLTKHELRYRLLHRHRDLIGEVPLGRHEFDALTHAINKYVEKQHYWFERLCEQFPALVSVFLVHCSLYGYTRRTANLWDSVWERLTIPRTDQRQQMLGKTFIRYLRSSDLIQFESSHRKYVDAILLHTPLPLECLPDFFRDVVQPRAEDPSLHLSELTNLIKPLEFFLYQGATVAEDLVARGVQLYNHLKLAGSTSSQDTDKSTMVSRLASEYGLPSVIVDHMVQWFPNRDTDVAVRRRMRLRFDPYGLGVVIDLPRRSQASTFEWDVTNGIVVELNGRMCRTVPYDGNWSSYGSTVIVPGPELQYELALADETERYACHGVDAEVVPSAVELRWRSFTQSCSRLLPHLRSWLASPP